MLLLSFRVGVDTDQDTSVSSYRLVFFFKHVIKEEVTMFPSSEFSGI